MSDITLVRQDPVEITEQEKAIATKVVFGIVDGLGARGKRQWRGFWKRLMTLQPGEMVDVKTHQARLGWYHRKHMALEQALFEAQEKFENFEAFRTWLKVGAGFVDWHPGPKGGVFPVPKSISYATLEQGAMEEFHRAAVDFLRTEHAQATLWRHLSVQQRDLMMETVLGGFGE